MLVLVVLLAGLVQGGVCRGVLPKENGLGVAIYAFETEINNLLEKLRDLCKNGIPEEGVPPLDPLSFGGFGFDLILFESHLNGSLGSLNIAKYSDFIAENLTFSIFPGLQLDLNLRFNDLHIDGRYNLDGSFFSEIPIHGRGSFTSDSSDLVVKILINLSSHNGFVYIKILDITFTIHGDKIVITNDEDGSTTALDEALIMSILDRIQAEYFPPLLNTVKIVVNDLLYHVTAEDILEWIRTGGAEKDIAIFVGDLYQLSLLDLGLIPM